MSADLLDGGLSIEARAHQDERSDKARAIEPCLASDQHSIAREPSVETEVDCITKSIEIDLLDGGIRNSISEFLNSPISGLGPGIHRDNRIEGKIGAILSTRDTVDDIVIISASHEEVGSDLIEESVWKVRHEDLLSSGIHRCRLRDRQVDCGICESE